MFNLYVFRLKTSRCGLSKARRVASMTRQRNWAVPLISSTLNTGTSETQSVCGTNRREVGKKTSHGEIGPRQIHSETLQLSPTIHPPPGGEGPQSKLLF